MRVLIVFESGVNLCSLFASMVTHRTQSTKYRDPSRILMRSSACLKKGFIYLCTRALGSETELAFAHSEIEHMLLRLCVRPRTV